MKKQIVLIAIIGILLMLLPLIAGAEIVASGTCGYNLTWTLDDYGLLTISGTGIMSDYGNEGGPWGKDSPKKIIIEEGVTSIGMNAFGGGYSGCQNVTEVVLPSTLSTIKNRAFFGCTQLTSILIPQSVTSIGAAAFANCESLSDFLIPKGITSIAANCFTGCTNLASIKIPKSVTQIGEYAFLYCENLNTVYYSGTADQWGNVQIDAYNDILNNVEIIFNHIEIVASGTCGDDLTWTLDDEGLLIISGTGTMNSFDSDSSEAWHNYKTDIINVIIENGVTSIGSFAFSGCSNLTSITMPDSMTVIEWYAFRNCSALYNVELPQNLSSLGHWAFDNCNSLTEIYIPEFVSHMDSAVFASCRNLEKIVVHENNSFFTSVDGVLFSRDLQTLYQYPSAKEGTGYEIPDSVTRIFAWAFNYCSNLTVITIPNSVTYLDWGVFSATGIESIVIPEGITRLPRSTFLYCASLRNVFIPVSVTEIDANIFYGCSSLVNIVVPSTDSYAYQWAKDNGYADKLVLESEIIHIDSATFPDDNFRDYISETIDNNPKDGLLTALEISNTKTINVPGNNISSLKGLECFSELNVLYADRNTALTEIDLSYNTKLTHISFEHCSLSELDVSHNPDLTRIICVGNKLTSLDLTNNKKLTWLSCQVNDLTSLDLRYNTSLAQLCCFANYISFIDLRNCPILDNLVRSTERQESEYGYDWGSVGSTEGFIRIDRTTILLDSNMKTMRLPSSISKIEEETFANISCQAILIPESCTTIGERAFAGCTELLYVRIPASIKSYPENAFEGCNANLVIDWEGH